MLLLSNYFWQSVCPWAAYWPHCWWGYCCHEYASAESRNGSSSRRFHSPPRWVIVYLVPDDICIHFRTFSELFIDKDFKGLVKTSWQILMGLVVCCCRQGAMVPLKSCWKLSLGLNSAFMTSRWVSWDNLSFLSALLLLSKLLLTSSFLYSQFELRFGRSRWPTTPISNLQYNWLYRWACWMSMGTTTPF